MGKAELTVLPGEGDGVGGGEERLAAAGEGQRSTEGELRLSAPGGNMGEGEAGASWPSLGELPALPQPPPLKPRPVFCSVCLPAAPSESHRVGGVYVCWRWEDALGGQQTASGAAREESVLPAS